MAEEAYFGSDYQLQNQLFELNPSTITYQDGYLSAVEGSSLQGISLNFSNQGVQMPGNINISIMTNQTKSGASFDESSFSTDASSSLHGSSYSQEHGINRVESLASISGPSTEDQLYVQRQGGQLRCPNSMPQFSVPSHQASVSPMMMFKKLRLETMTEESLLSKYRQQMALLNAIQLNCYNDRVMASRLLQKQQNPQHVPNSKILNNQPLLSAGIQPQQAANTVLNDGLADRRLMSYVHCRRQRPPDNNIEYWRSFVKYFYSPKVQKRTCFSNYAHTGRHIHGVFVLTETWKCELCGSTSGKGFVETFDVLPRMNQLYFSRDVIDELLYLDIPTEKRLPEEFLMVSFEKAVQKTIYMHCCVVHEGKLQVIFTPQLEIISWDFCVQHHEVYLPRRLITSQVNDFVKIATRCQSNADAKGHDGVKEQDLASNGHRVAAVGRKLATTLGQTHVSDLGFPKHFVRCLQVSEVFNAMKDLMTCSINNILSPIETLKQYGQKIADTKPEMRHMKFRSPMQQTPGPPDPRNFPAYDVHFTRKSDHTCQTPTNYMAQTPISYGKVTYNSPSLYQQSSLGPSSAWKAPIVEQFMLNDLLSHFQKEGTKRTRHMNYNPDGEDEDIVHGGLQKKRRLHIFDNSQVNNELKTGLISGGKAEIGKGFNSSSSSNQDCNSFKKDTDLDEDFTSPSPAQTHSVVKCDHSQ